MLHAQHVLALAGTERFDRRRIRLAARALLIHVADHDGVEHGGDACRGALRIVRDGRGDRIPDHAGARHQVLLEVVGVQLDQARQQPVAFPVLGAGQLRPAPVDGPDAATVDHDTAREGLAGRHDACIADDSFAHDGFPWRATCAWMS